MDLLITAIVSGLVALVPLVANLLREKHERTQARHRRRLYGVSRDTYPRLLAEKHLVEFTDYDKWFRSGLEQGVLIYRDLSYALRCCDFVFTREGFDPKMVDYDDDEAVARIIDG